MSKNSLTENQLSELKKDLFREEGNLQKTIKELKESDPFLDPDHTNDNAAIDTDVREQLGHDTVEAEVKALEKKLELVRIALTKMSKGTYGICEKTKKPIGYERLELVPEARFCIEIERKLTK
ncbi:hypothetical protein A2957_03035 [Candidatus Roizmanbacteria bacterium RIFCSPLOWO2_01_FULL_38_11]|uniref:Zinc finger DksA/TraR C4-type domain-containing protein n=1 Tax=Candidatus Roizmanbacteria bacterium RIFCSPLOWO2_01_FULL_38_11 TaxID=1802060 RepID=A0A1F7INA8_9BACT|nr:MAG: hypothetical protein A2957_03035 [Candidatus Roizmanbacteria bacterium RIFCSPLOWO2_01_FULL_38_11]